MSKIQPRTQSVELHEIPYPSAPKTKYDDDAISVSSDEDLPTTAGTLDDKDLLQRKQRRRRNLRIGLFTAGGVVTILLILLFFVPLSPISIWSIRDRALQKGTYFSRDTALTNATDDDALVLQESASWMSSLPDATVLTDLYIPGTHDSVARYGGSDYACQSLSILQQLQIGVRFFDMRLFATGGSNETLAGRHGKVDQGVTWLQILDTTSTFLTANPSELVIMKIQQESSNSTTFGSTVAKSLTDYPVADTITQDTTPLGDLRGQILIVSRDFTLPAGKGLSYDAVEKQDDFKVDLTTKRSRVGSFAAADAGDRLALNFLSLHNNVESPALAAQSINAMVPDLTVQETTRPQVLLLDFPSQHAIQVIIDTNFAT